MKRGRHEDIQFGPRTGPTTTHHRIITSTPHNAGNPTIQYQISNVHREAPTVVAQTQNVQYTNYNASTITSNKTNITPNQGGGVPVQVVQTSSVNTSVVRQKGPPPPGNVNVAMSQSVSSATQAQTTGAGQAQFQRLKVEDALSYLDQVKYKFGNQPQVYNDFLDIMKEFKSQSIDTPGVIQRVSNLFKGHPELIVGFNTFLPPGYKIEVQANDQGYAYQVSVSVPSPSGNTISIPTEPSPPHNKVQILQGSGQIVHSLSSAVNLNHPHNLHTMHNLQPPQTPQQQQASANQHQQTILPQMNTITIPIAQNYSRNRERSLSVNQSPQTPSSTTPQSTNQTHQPQANATIHSESSSGLHRISQQLLQQTEQNNQNQPVEFNHAISYVNKIKNRFQNQPEKYKRFLEILHTYQKEQKVGDKLLTEAEVYTQVAKLFDNQEDLLREFGQFLPDATSIGSGSASSGVRNNKNQNALQDLGNLKKLSSSSGPPNAHANIKAFNLNNLTRTLDGRNNVNSGSNNMQINSLSINEFHNFANNDKEYGMQTYHGSVREKDGRNHHSNNQKYGPISGSNSAGIKRSPSYNVMPINHLNRGHASDKSDQPPMKRHKPICRDVSLAEASKYGTLNDYAFFDKVRKALRTPDVYDNFLRCLTLYNQEIVSKSELITLVTPFLSKSPDLLRWFQDFLGPSNTPEGIPMASAQRQDHRSQTELAQDIDLTQCKRLGASYCALPKPNEIKKCSGRTTLCREVLNDVWVSFPTWAEDSTFVTSRKTQYEEFIYRCEDERFELDVVIETNSATIRVLEGVQKKLSRMTPDEVARYRLDDCLGGTSPTIHQRAMRRIYGEKSSDIIQGLKKNPVVAVPVVLRRLKAKEEEWREAQKGFNKQWREQNEKYYLKSLDHQGINFKQNDVKALRSKSLFNEIETLYDERHEQNEEGATNEPLSGPHLILPYKDKTILEDAANLLIHHVKRQTGIQKQEKARIKHILRQFVPDLFFSPRQPLSDDEREDAEDATENFMDDKSSKGDDLPTTSTALVDAISNDDTKCINAEASSDSSKCNPINDKSSSFPQQSAVISADSSSDLSKNRKNSEHNTPTVNAETTMTVRAGSVDEIKIEIKQETDDVTNSSHILTTTGNQQLPPHAVSKHPEEAYTLFLANNNWYLFLRLHSILCERLRTMYERTQVLVAEEEVHKTSRRESTAVSLRLKPQSDTEISEYYPTFLEMLKNLLDGNLDANNYEDKLRDMFGIHAYIAFTLDRVVSNAVRQLQHCVTERGALECVELFQLESRKNGAGGACKTANKRLAAELAYQRRAESSLQDENCFKVFIYKIDCRITIELLDTETEDASTTNVSNVQAWSKYTEGFINPAASASQSNTALGSLSLNKNRSNSYNGGVIDPMSANVEIKTERPDDEVNTAPRRPLFLARNIRKFNKKNVPSSKDLTAITPNFEEPLDDASNSHQAIICRVQSNDIEKISSTSIISSAASCTLTTSMSGIPPPFIPLGTSPPTNVINDSFWNKRPPERIGAHNNTDSSVVVDDRQQIKLNVNTFKMVFLGNDYFFYKKQCLKRAKQTHPQVSKTMHVRFDAFVQRWLEINVSDIQRITLDDWLLGRNQNDLMPCKTFVLRDNNIKETPYYSYSRYNVKYATES